VAEPANGSPTPGMPASSLIPSFEPEVLVDFVIGVLSITLGATKSELEAAGNFLHPTQRAETVQKLARYATETMVALYVTKDALVSEEPAPDTACERSAVPVAFNDSG